MVSRDGVALQDLGHLLLSHIHLDHAGAAGVLVREHPALQVHVSEVGAPHLIDPSRLEASARRLYGDAFDVLWGELAPVPDENVHEVGDQVLGLDCFPTPGHAWHHVSYLHADGTLAEILTIPGGGSVHPVTHDLVEKRLQFIRMNGREVYKIAVRSLTEVTEEALAANKLAAGDITHVALAQQLTGPHGIPSVSREPQSIVMTKLDPLPHKPAPHTWVTQVFARLPSSAHAEA